MRLQSGRIVEGSLGPDGHHAPHHRGQAQNDRRRGRRRSLSRGHRAGCEQCAAKAGRSAWSKAFELSHALVFRYSAITWNAHRIRYDADYARREEGYPQAVQNGGLTVQLIIDAALPHLTGFTARLTRPLWVGDPLTVFAAAAGDGRMSCWGVDKQGYHCAAVELECAR